MAENNGVGGVTSQRQRGSAFAGGLQQATDPRANVPQGLPGPAGATGPAGPAGPMGAAGRDGRDGTDGRDGDSILNVTDARNNADDGSILTITFTDGRTPVEVAIPDGPDGPAGPAGRGIQTVTGSPAVAGQPITVTVTFTDSTTATFAVPAGADGAAGAAGAPGAQGDPGMTGPQGDPGDTGPAGAQGFQGIGIDDVRATPQTANPSIIDLAFAFDNPAGTDPANVITSFRVPDTTFTPTSTGGTIDITGSNFEVDNPFTDADETKLGLLEVGTITQGTLQDDGSRTYTATIIGGSPVSWTTGGGTNPQPVESFSLTATPNRIEVGNPLGLSNVRVNFAVSTGFSFTSYRNLLVNGVPPTGVNAQGTEASINIPIGNFPTTAVTTLRITAEILSTNDDSGRPVSPETAHADVRIFMGAQDIYYRYLTSNNARPGNFNLDSATDTEIDGFISVGGEASFTTVAPATVTRDNPVSLVVAYPTQSGVTLHNRFGTITETTPVSVTDNDDAPVVPYTGVIIDNITGVIRLSIER